MKKTPDPVADDRIAFNEIVNSCSRQLLSTAAYITRDPYVAEDIVQEAFMELWKKRAEIVYDNPGGWLYRVVYNLAHKHLKRQWYKTRLHTTLQSDRQPLHNEVEERLIYRESIDEFDKVYSRLPRMQQKVYRLSRQEGLSRNEIASHLNISPNTVKVHLLRAMQFIKEHIGAACLFFGIFLLNNIFFKDSNTKTGFRELYKATRKVENDGALKLFHPENINKSI